MSAVDVGVFNFIRTQNLMKKKVIFRNFLSDSHAWYTSSWFTTAGEMGFVIYFIKIKFWNFPTQLQKTSPESARTKRGFPMKTLFILSFNSTMLSFHGTKLQLYRDTTRTESKGEAQFSVKLECVSIKRRCSLEQCFWIRGIVINQFSFSLNNYTEFII